MNHLAIIADGNRRWAKANGLPAVVGYPQGLVTIEKCCEWAIERGVQYLTFFCFSTENWGRPTDEVDGLMNLARSYFADRREWYLNMNIKVLFSGRRDRLAADLVSDLQFLSEYTNDCNALVLTFCIDYGGRDEIARAIESGATTEEEITALLTKNAPAPDAILRTGGQRRLSNFLLWQAAYSELFFSDTLFPALTEEELDRLLKDYQSRSRNFGK